jgi:hypothetical protein
MHIESGEGASAGSENALHDRPAATVPPIAYPWEYGCKSIRVYLGFVPSHWRRMRYLIQTRTLRSLYAAISPSRMLTRDALDEREGRRAMEIVSFTINLEHIGDIIDKNLCELATKKIKRGYQFSPEGAAELTAFHKRVCEGLQAAFGIFMTGDVDAARRLLREKAELRKAEIEAADRHFDRLREGRPESLETTSLHLDALADRKRIYSHICSVAYPVLEAAGELPVLGAAKNETAADGVEFRPKLP